jgi:hypothetical protein
VDLRMRPAATAEIIVSSQGLVVDTTETAYGT